MMTSLCTNILCQDAETRSLNPFGFHGNIELRSQPFGMSHSVQQIAAR